MLCVKELCVIELCVKEFCVKELRVKESCDNFGVKELCLKGCVMCDLVCERVLCVCVCERGAGDNGVYVCVA